MAARTESMGPVMRWLFPGMGVKRWIIAMMVGIGMISIGIGYLLVSVYRAAPLPDAFYYITLQFIPREIRGILFLAIGFALTAISVVQINRTLLRPFLDTMGEESLSDVIYRHRTLSGGPTIVCVGGGPGLSIALRGLKNETANLWGITLGHGPARTRSELGLLRDRVLRASLDDVEFVAELPDGSRIEGESAIMARRNGEAIKRMSVRRRDGLPAEADPEAIDRIKRADAIVIGPGDLFGSVIPTLLVPDIANAIRSSEAKKIFVCNMMTQAGRTTAFSVADHIRAIHDAAKIQVDYVLVNNVPPGEKLIRAYRDAFQSQVVFDPQAAGHLSQVTFANTDEKVVLVEGAFLVEADMATDLQEELLVDREGREVHKRLTVIRHDPVKLGGAIGQIVRGESWRRKTG